jgi:hypothetical protein
MSIEPPTKSIANGQDLALDDTSTTAWAEQSLMTTTTTPTDTTTPSTLAQSDDELKRLRLQVLDCVEAEEDRQQAQQNHELEDEDEMLLNQGKEILDDKEEMLLNQGKDTPRPDGLTPSANLDASSLVADPPGSRGILLLAHQMPP